MDDEHEVDVSSSSSCQTRIFRRQDIAYNEEADMVGSGGFGVVYRCRLENSSELAAIKVLSTLQQLHKSEEEDLIREANILHSLGDCPYIVRFLGLCIEPGHYAIVMEYLEYGNLEDMLLSGVDDHPAIKQWDCRIHMAVAIAKGMEYLHSLATPIIHRDLKTTNVLVCCNYSCKIIDFGLARVREISSQTTSSVKGTLAFTAPELFNQSVKKEKEMKIDVYSYAIVLWQLKEMKSLYADVLPAVIRANVLSGERPSLTDDENIEGYIQLIVRCWDKQPECRLDFKEIITMLHGIRSLICPVPFVIVNSDVANSSRNSTFAALGNSNLYVASNTDLAHFKQQKNLVPSSTPISHLMDNTHIHEGLQMVAEVMDKEDDIICDDWRSLWSDLLDERSLNEEMMKQIRLTSSPTLYVLRKWMCKSACATVGKLIQRLTAIDRNDVAAVMRKFVHKQGEVAAETALLIRRQSKVKRENLVLAATLVSCNWERCAAMLDPLLFTVSKTEEIRKQYKHYFTKSRAVLETWANSLDKKATNGSLISVLLHFLDEANVVKIFGQDLVEYVKTFP